jgi:hypothetical protein
MIMKVYHKKRKRFTIETQRTQRRVFLGRGKEDLPQRHRDYRQAVFRKRRRRSLGFKTNRGPLLYGPLNQTLLGEEEE